MDNEDKMREEFEEWISHYIGKSWLSQDKVRVGEYLDNNIQFMWEAWKASRSALCVDLPMCTNESQDAYFRELVDELETLGVNYK